MALSVALLRFRLYDIDVVINRTLVYGALTATLGGAYLGSVLLLQLAAERDHRRLGPRGRRLDARRGGAVPPCARAHPGTSSTGASTGASTTPRSTLERFGARLRDEVDLARSEQRSCGAVVTETLQPAHVAVWLRSPGADLSARVEPEWAMVTVLFVDIRGFTTLRGPLDGPRGGRRT